MKKFWTKKITIAVTIAILLASVAYLLHSRTPKSFRLATLLSQLLSANEAQASPQPLMKPKRGEVLAARLNQNEDELQSCYQTLLHREAQDPSSSSVEEGTVHVHMTIDPTGTVDSLEMIHSDLSDETFQSCVLEKIKASRQPATADRLGVVISHRFHFKKKDQGPLNFEE
jgi:outer membrane biosynthesis protein TonB